MVEGPFRLAAGDGAELAFLEADAALDALRLVDHMRLLDGAGDAGDRAVAGAQRAADALVLVDLVADELLALAQGGIRVMNGEEKAKNYADF